MSDFDDLLKLQRNMASRLASEARMERTLTLLSILQSIIPDKQGRIQKEAVLLEAYQQGVDEMEAEQLLEQLRIDRYLRIVDDSFIVLL